MKKSPRPKVLMIDEDPVACEAVAHALKRRGIQLVAEHDPEAGMKELEKGGYPLVLLDVRFDIVPRGYDLLERIRSHETLKDLPVIILSNAALEHEIRRGMEGGADAYLVKADMPIAEVAERVEKVLDEGVERDKG